MAFKLYQLANTLTPNDKNNNIRETDLASITISRKLLHMLEAQRIHALFIKAQTIRGQTGYVALYGMLGENVTEWLLLINADVTSK